MGKLVSRVGYNYWDGVDFGGLGRDVPAEQRADSPKRTSPNRSLVAETILKSSLSGGLLWQCD